MFSGETVYVTPATLRDAYTNEYGEFTPGGDYIPVNDVLVAPADTGDFSAGVTENRDRRRLTLYFPKTFTTDLRGATVEVRRKKYKVVGAPVEYPSELTPTRWHLAATVEQLL